MCHSDMCIQGFIVGTYTATQTQQPCCHTVTCHSITAAMLPHKQSTRHHIQSHSNIAVGSVGYDAPSTRHQDAPSTRHQDAPSTMQTIVHAFVPARLTRIVGLCNRAQSSFSSALSAAAPTIAFTVNWVSCSGREDFGTHIIWKIV